MSVQSERIEIQLGEVPESGVALLNDLHEFIGRFCVFPDGHAHKAATLWAAHTHMVEHFYTTPRLARVRRRHDAQDTMPMRRRRTRG